MLLGVAALLALASGGRGARHEGERWDALGLFGLAGIGLLALRLRRKGQS